MTEGEVRDGELPAAVRTENLWKVFEHDGIAVEAVRGVSLDIERGEFVVLAGPSGSGKTTLLNAMSAYIDGRERIVTIEDAVELRLRQRHVVRLESRPPNVEGKGQVMIRDLVRNSLRMRPDRIVVGEVRGGEALDMLQAMNTGHDGSLTTIHANSCRDAVQRVETMVMMAGSPPPWGASSSLGTRTVSIFGSHEKRGSS